MCQGEGSIEVASTDEYRGRFGEDDSLVCDGRQQGVVGRSKGRKVPSIPKERTMDLSHLNKGQVPFILMT